MTFSKAFDFLLHELIFRKFREYSTDDQTATTVENYFSNRQQRVKVWGQYSSWSDVRAQFSALYYLIFL